MEDSFDDGGVTERDESLEKWVASDTKDLQANGPFTKPSRVRRPA